MRQHVYFILYLISYKSQGALRAPTSSWRLFGPLDFVLRALRALRPRDPRIKIGQFWQLLTIFDHFCHFCHFLPLAAAGVAGGEIQFSRSEDILYIFYLLLNYLKWIRLVFKIPKCTIFQDGLQRSAYMIMDTTRSVLYFQPIVWTHYQHQYQSIVFALLEDIGCKGSVQKPQ